ncbi:hypothetical protein [Flavobacterium sp. WC2430]|uniref:hypothetical protein n=1 Tax=Flavobacterium sp. WC2430 TaxID=3234137 RepID=UPI00346745BD
MLINEKKIASIHEAGHAIIYHIYGYNIDSITLTDDGSGMVNALSYKPTTDMINSDLNILFNKMDIYGMICLSGYCAELKFKNKRLNGLMTISNPNKDLYLENDIDSLRNEMKKGNEILGDEYFDNSYFYFIQTDTRKFIGKKKIWDAIINLSEELMSSETSYFEGKRVHEILNKHVKHGAKKNEYCNIINFIN